MKLLKQVTSGEIYVWTPELAARKDMVPFEREAPKAPEPAVDVPVAEAAVPAAEPAQKRTRSSFKKALAAKAQELTNDDQVSGA